MKRIIFCFLAASLLAVSFFCKVEISTNFTRSETIAKGVEVLKEVKKTKIRNTRNSRPLYAHQINREASFAKIL